MKKIALCSLAVFFVLGNVRNAAGANPECKREFSPGNNNWLTYSNEYLFPTERDFMDAKNIGDVWECDDDNCGNNTYVCVGDKHAFKSNEKSSHCYKCVLTAFDDYWEPVDSTAGLTQCSSDKMVKGTALWFKNAEADEYLYPTWADYQSVKSHRTGMVYECDNGACPIGSTVTLDTVHYHGTTRKDVSKGARTYKCIDSDQWVDITDDINKDCPDCKKGGNKKTAPKGKTCEELYPNGSKERLACCHAGDTTEWENEQCVCVDSTLVWNGATCIQKSEETDCVYRFIGSVVCSNGGRIDANTMIKLTKDDLNGNSCNDFLSLLERDKSKVMALADKYCRVPNVEPQPTPQPTPQPKVDPEKIKNAREKLSAFFKKVDSDRSVWKNADGSFNGARLASDLTAGVVLGTVGGVVSGVLIKKSQVEKGFDALNCTVNGQKVADWGDEFSVGLRR